MTWVVLNSPSRAQILGDVTPPTYVSSEIGLVDNNTLVVTFSEVLFSPTADYKTGFTVQLDGVTATINTGTLSGGSKKIELNLVEFAYRGVVVTVKYDAPPGNIEDANSNAMVSFGYQTATDNAGSGFLFNKKESSMWWLYW